MMNPGEVGSMETLLSGWRRGRGLGKHFTAMHEIPPKQAIYGDFPEALNPNLQQMLRERGFTKLYSHQAQAVEKALAGDDVVVVTPTASGKSDVAMEVARHTGGGIVSVDSMQVYRGMDLGTAKPSAE